MEWLGRPAKLRMELRLLPSGRWEGVLTGAQLVDVGR
jgi:hypothetical protein